MYCRNNTQFLCFLILALAAACTPSGTATTTHAAADSMKLAAIETLLPEAFAARMTKFQEINLLDVRSEEEYAAGHLDHAANVDVNGDDFEMNVSTLNRELPVFVYCRSGSRSTMAANRLQKMGFRQVVELAGGIAAWQQAGLQVVNPGETTGGLSLAEYNRLVAASDMVLVDFGAVWCGPCRGMKPVIEKIARENEKIVTLKEIDVDENPTIAQAMSIGSLPTVMLYKNGKKVWSTIGFDDKTEAAILNALIKNK